ncbi:DUF1189 family protein [bacterium]|nr:DUF1189 family protein [bacterium]
MFKLFRDSIFAPKNIIHYRAKSGWFTFFYVFLVTAFMGLVTMSRPLAYSSLSFLDKKEIVSKFENTDAEIQNGELITTDEIEIYLEKVTIGFYSSLEFLNVVPSPTPIAVVQDKIYYVRESTFGRDLLEIVEIKDLSADFLNVNLHALDLDSPIFTAIDNLILKYKPYVVTISFIVGTISGAISMMAYALISYLFFSISLNTGKFMKKGQLFKMMTFASTSVVLMLALIRLFNLNGLLIFIFLLISFIPLSILEREIARRIRAKVLGEGLLGDKIVRDKINEMMNNIDNTEEDNLSRDDTNDDDDDDDLDRYRDDLDN